MKIKLKTVAQICKKEGYLGLCDGNDQQWVNTNNAFYPLGNLPKLDINNLATIFDFTEKQLESTITKHFSLPEEFNFSDVCKNEKFVYPAQDFGDILTINFGEERLMPVTATEELVFLNADYLKPLAKLDELDFYERRMGTIRYFVVKRGLFVVAVILPEHMLPDQIKLLEELLEQMTEEKRAAENLATENTYNSNQLTLVK
ncbi:MAG: hypothetical protein FWG63_00425 [Defluviitaleaceae bacterium]|nr:hypothetical protein [Defluviitaleaceae bacterium]